MESLPLVNYNLLKYICRYLELHIVQIISHFSLYLWIKTDFSFRFLDEVQSYSGVNKMTVQNLATVFGPNILRPKVEDPVAIMEGKVVPKQNECLKIKKW